MSGDDDVKEIEHEKIFEMCAKCENWNVCGVVKAEIVNIRNNMRWELKN